MQFTEKGSLLGELLVSEGILTREQLNIALEKQKSSKQVGKKGLLGATLVELGFCKESDISKAIAKKAGVEYLEMQNYNIDMAAVNLITPELAKKYNALPLGFKDGKLLLAMKNPGDIVAIDDIRIITGHNIKPVVINDKELETAIKRFENMSIMQLEQEEIEEVEKEEENVNDDLNQRPAVQLANQIINQAAKAGASDIHIEPQEKRLRIRYRIDGVLHEIMQQPISIHPSLVSRIKVLSNMDIAERRIPQDGRTTLKIDSNIIDVRVATMPSAYGEKITMRLLNRNDRFITLKELGFNESELEKYESTLHSPYGFILITGPTGSGKSTTLYASLAILNQPDKNIITLEDPVERRIEGLTQIQTNPKAGLTFASGLRAILRNDPDIIMVGEIRDHETARIAIESALTGHLVLSTMHTNDSAGAITRLNDMGIEPYLSSSSLIGVVAQRLVRVLCKECKQKYIVTKNQLLNSVPDFPLAGNEEEIELYKTRGCVYCNGTGYRGRVGIYEFLRVTEAIQNLILSKVSAREVRETAIKEGMLTMKQDGFLKVKQGITTVEEVLRVIV
ncbi:MAG TPA: Flp pilus assembly complex ATPase component TadA [Clostridiaceae bacterium]|nr:Flp pilus assembly complex ATPase component TadA [Clostridiaceae bacterium]